MASAYLRNIIFPNKKKENYEKFYRGHFLDNETYIGGKVECLQSGVFRSDINFRFKLSPEAYDELIGMVDKVVDFAAKVENGAELDEVSNLADVKQSIIGNLAKIRDIPNPHNHECKPILYHLDVAAMYPNIILTNRLQPVSIVNENM